MCDGVIPQTWILRMFVDLTYGSVMVVVTMALLELPASPLTTSAHWVAFSTSACKVEITIWALCSEGISVMRRPIVWISLSIVYTISCSATTVAYDLVMMSLSVSSSIAHSWDIWWAMDDETNSDIITRSRAIVVAQHETIDYGCGAPHTWSSHDGDTFRANNSDSDLHLTG